MAERFFTTDALGPGEYHLSGAEAHHLSTVRRFATGDRIILFNGDGNEYSAEVIAAGKKSVALNILSVFAVDRELPFPLVIASALPKGDRADYLIEKLTELGVTSFVPLVTARSVVVPKTLGRGEVHPNGHRGEQAVRPKPSHGDRLAAEVVRVSRHDRAGNPASSGRGGSSSHGRDGSRQNDCGGPGRGLFR